MDNYFNIFNNRLVELVQISITERHNNGLGILYMDFSNKDKMDCYYLSINNDKINENIKKTIIERYNNSPKSIIYFYLFDNNCGEILEIDLDKSEDKSEDKSNDKSKIKD